jgi:hypothetical protein
VAAAQVRMSVMAAVVVVPLRLLAVCKAVLVLAGIQALAVKVVMVASRPLLERVVVVVAVWGKAGPALHPVAVVEAVELKH